MSARSMNYTRAPSRSNNRFDALPTYADGPDGTTTNLLRKMAKKERKKEERRRTLARGSPAPPTAAHRRRTARPRGRGRRRRRKRARPPEEQAARVAARKRAVAEAHATKFPSETFPTERDIGVFLGPALDAAADVLGEIDLGAFNAKVRKAITEAKEPAGDEDGTAAAKEHARIVATEAQRLGREAYLAAVEGGGELGACAFVASNLASMLGGDAYAAARILAHSLGIRTSLWAIDRAAVRAAFRRNTVPDDTTASLRTWGRCMALLTILRRPTAH